jgi:hypothetical protein
VVNFLALDSSPSPIYNLAPLNNAKEQEMSNTKNALGSPHQPFSANEVRHAQLQLVNALACAFGRNFAEGISLFQETYFPVDPERPCHQPTPKAT